MTGVNKGAVDSKAANEMSRVDECHPFPTLLGGRRATFAGKVGDQQKYSKEKEQSNPYEHPSSGSEDMVDDVPNKDASVTDVSADVTSQDFDGHAETIKVKEQLENAGFVLLSGSLMKKLLLFYGATEEDLLALEAGEIHDELPKDPEQTMHFRRLAFNRMVFEDCQSIDASDGSSEYSEQVSPCRRYISSPYRSSHPCSTTRESPARPSTHDPLNSGDTNSCNSLEPRRRSSLRESFHSNAPGVTQIAQCEIASGKEGCAKVEFKRSGTRYWPLPPRSYAESSVPAAMAALNQLLTPAIHHKQENIDHMSNVIINDQIPIRVTRSAGASDAHSPTPEGIHQDNTEISSVTLIRLDGVREGGESRIWDLSVPTGNYNSLDAMPWEKCKLNHALRKPWETVYFNDREVKHEAREFDGTRPCTRDVIVNFIRKPLKDGTDEVEPRDGDDESEGCSSRNC